MSGNVIARTMVAGALALVIVGGCAKKSAQENLAPNEIATKQPAQSSDQSTANKAVRAYIDPKTGEVRDPTPEELAAEAAAESQKKQAAAVNKSAEQTGQREVVRPTGETEIILDPSRQRPLRASVG
ncbi:MAG TPA: hypothetical protein VET48_04640 [Steroidobacteraceae bacterium]|nr:hypothetical protein [Steroidobacteraceae bacterium]